MGDDEYRGFYIEVPRPTPEEWGDAEELIALGEYNSREAFLADWFAFNPMETRWFHVASSQYGDSRSIRVTDRKRGFSGHIYTDPQDVPEELRDVVYYKRKKFVDVTEMYDIYSPEDFMQFATDHYGELGLSRLNIFASHDRQEGWRIVVSNSYSANVGLAIEGRGLCTACSRFI